MHKARFAVTRDARVAEQVFGLFRRSDACPDDLCFVGSSILGLVRTEPALAKRARIEILQRMETVKTSFVVEAWNEILEDLDEYDAAEPRSE